MNQKVTPLLLLVFALLCFLATVALHYNIPSLGASTNFDRQITSVTNRCNSFIAEAEKEALFLGKQLTVTPISFSELLPQSIYPTFIYKDNRLVYWSDHMLVPDLDITNTITSVTTVKSKYGYFIVVPHHANGYDIYVCVPLQVNGESNGSDYSLRARGNILTGIDANLELENNKQPTVIYTKDNEFLFALNFDTEGKHLQHENLKLIMLLLGVIFFVSFSSVIARNLYRRGMHNKGAILFLSLIIGLRLVLLLLDLPYSIADVELFDPKLYAASFWSPSIGDLALNMLVFVTVASVALYLFNRNRLLAQLKLMPVVKVKKYLIGCLLFFYLLLAVLYQFYHGLYHNSPIILDITQSLTFTKYKLIIYGIMVAHTIAVSLFTFMLSTVFSVLIKRVDNLWPYKVLLLLSVLLITITSVLKLDFLAVITIGILFWGIITIAAQNDNAVSLPYRTYLFFFMVIMVSAIVGAFALYDHYQDELKIYKQKFASNLLQDNDVLGEYLLEEISAKIASDAFIQNKMMGPYIDAGFIKRKISKQYLQEYFDKYETNVLLFDSEGQTLESADTTAATLQELLQKYNTPQTQTERPNLFLVKDPSRYNSRTYFKLIDIPIGSYLKGTIVLQLTLKKLLPNSVVPELLVDQTYTRTFRTDMLSYAIYKQDKLINSEGDYDYATNFDRNLISLNGFFNQGMNLGNHHHLGVRDESGHTLVITTEKYGVSEILSNFSFLFLTYTASLMLLGLMYLLIQRRRLKEFSPNFSTKIQFFLNFGILLPLLLVSVATAGLVTSSYKKDLMTTYEQRGEAIQENLGKSISKQEQLGNKELRSKIYEIAALAEADINLYDRNGKLVVTSQPLIFEAGLLSDLLNPQAFAAISERQALRVMLEEQTGNLNFNAVYLPLRNETGTNELIGFIGIPFFDSEKKLDLKLIELITTTMNIFTVMFIMFMVLTFFASRALTVPLRMLAEKLKRTSLTGKNEMLAYEGADEIGMLVNEYNRMLLTLEQNKEELAMQEKEAAWREMARQVAHEIKNPLTPMKLSLQYLQKAIAEKKPNTEQLIEKISHTLITQINILSDIATSFSSFTSMPEPKQERIDIAAALRKSANLHNDPATAVVETNIAEDEVIVVTDESLMVRTFNNLLLNAIQAVPTSRKPYISINLETKPDNTVLISIKDNGSGIPKEIRGKVFVPNFSTKYTGSGIGLAVAKKGIENAGGRIWFETEEGKGTTFYVSLPLANV